MDILSLRRDKIHKYTTQVSNNYKRREEETSRLEEEKNPLLYRSLCSPIAHDPPPIGIYPLILKMET
jgi:hypothetical protein